MKRQVKGHCVYCGADVLYNPGTAVVKCEACGRSFALRGLLGRPLPGGNGPDVAAISTGASEAHGIGRRPGYPQPLPGGGQCGLKSNISHNLS